MSKILDTDIGSTIESLRDLFERNANDLHTPEMKEAVAKVIEEANVIDTSVPEGFPRRDVPLWMALNR